MSGYKNFITDKSIITQQKSLPVFKRYNSVDDELKKMKIDIIE